MPPQNPSLYQADFFAHWETFADELTRAFELNDPDAAARPLATEQGRYAIAILAVAELLKNLGQDKSADKFHRLAERMQDLAEGIPQPFFKVEQPIGKPGRHKDTSAVWRMRASVCIGLEYLIASGMEPGDAVEFAMKKHRRKLAKLQRPGTDLQKSLETWLKSFATDSVTNEAALESYKYGMRGLNPARLTFPGNKIRQAGERLIANAAERASHLA